ncbi:hypothetical protein [Cohnella cellulosilytica]|uniref:DUF4179 domain-containing protein n=1 Tax=Cohnella cellulosilytica TaxID=986710 RepID=A0ABW2F528_9BACL
MSENRIKRLFDGLAPTDEQKERMYRSIVAHSGSENAKHSPGAPAKRIRLAILAAVLMVLLTTTAFAAGFGGLDAGFLRFLSPSSPEQADDLSNGAYAIDKQTSNENGTLIVKQAIGDGNLTYILMDFIGPENVVLDAARYRFENPNTTTDESFHGTGFELLDDGNPDDNKISLVMSLMTENSLQGQTARFRFTDLQAADPYPGLFRTVLPGEWEVSFKLDFKAYSSVYRPDKRINLYGYEAVLKSVSVSPISIALKVESKFLKEIGEASGERREIGPNQYADEYPVTINYKDGTSETTGIFTGLRLSDLLSSRMLIIKTFEQVINDKEIASVVFFGVEIPLADRSAAPANTPAASP